MHTIPLATFGWQKVEPHLQVNPTTINLSLPSRFGDLPWMLDRDEVAIVDTRDQVVELCDDLLCNDLLCKDTAAPERADFSHLNVPYLATSTAAAPPTTGLLFHQPKQHPNLGRLDGFLVREERPGQLIELAAALGLETASGLQWFANHRRAVPPGAAPLHSTLRRVESAGVASAAAGGGLFFLAAGQSMHHRTGRLGLAMLLGGATIAVVSDWLGRHRDSNGSHAHPPRDAGDYVASHGESIGT